MPLKSIRAWLGIESTEQQQEITPLRETLDALDQFEPDRARYLAAFAYLLGRVAHADRHVSAEETRVMEALLRQQGNLSQDQAMVVVQLAKTSNLLFGGTENFLVAREFSALATYDQKLSLMRCLFALSATDEAISTAEEGSSTASRTSFASIARIWWRCGSRMSGTCPACRASNRSGLHRYYYFSSGVSFFQIPDSLRNITQ